MCSTANGLYRFSMRATVSILNPAKARLLLIRNARQISGEEGWLNI